MNDQYENIYHREQEMLFERLPRIKDPQRAAFEMMRSAMRVYQADWCGVLDVDMTANTYNPYWWIEEGTGEMAPTLFHTLELNESYERWVEALLHLKPIVVADVDKDLNVQADEKKCYKRLQTHAVIGCPYSNHGVVGFLVIRNARRFQEESSYLAFLSYLITAKIGEQKSLDSLEMRITEKEILREDEVRIYLFGGIRIRTKGYELLEKELNSTGSWNILVYLLMHRRRCCTTQELMEVDYIPASVDDRKKSVRQKINRFNQKFKLICSYDLIVRDGTAGKEARYCINPELKVWIDFAVYDDLMKQVQITSSRRTKMILIGKMMELYQGHAYPSQELEDWFVNTSAYYRRMNLEHFEILAEHMRRRHRYRELLEYSMMLYHAMPDERDAYLWLAYCLKKVHREKDARRILEEAKNRLSIEEGMEIERELTDRFDG